MSVHDHEALRTIVRTLHKDYHNEFDCDAMDDDATEDHSAEMAVAGQIIMDLRRDGLTIAKKRSDAGKSRRST